MFAFRKPAAFYQFWSIFCRHPGCYFLNIKQQILFPSLSISDGQQHQTALRSLLRLVCCNGLSKSRSISSPIASSLRSSPLHSRTWMSRNVSAVVGRTSIWWANLKPFLVKFYGSHFKRDTLTACNWRLCEPFTVFYVLLVHRNCCFAAAGKATARIVVWLYS